MVGKCDTPLCLTTCGEDCGSGEGCDHKKEYKRVMKQSYPDYAENNGIMEAVEKALSNRRKVPQQVQFRIVDGLCLEALKNDELHLGKCDKDNTNQMWTYTPSVKQIKQIKEGDKANGKSLMIADRTNLFGRVGRVKKEVFLSACIPSQSPPTRPFFPSTGSSMLESIALKTSCLAVTVYASGRTTARPWAVRCKHRRVTSTYPRVKSSQTSTRWL